MMIIPDHVQDSPQEVRALNFTTRPIGLCTNLKHSFHHSVTSSSALLHHNTFRAPHTYMYKCINLSAESSLAVHKRYNLCGEEEESNPQPVPKLPFDPVGWLVGWGDLVKRLQMIIPSLPPTHYNMPSIPYHTITTCPPYHTIPYQTNTTSPPYPAYHTIPRTCGA